MNYLSWLMHRVYADVSARYAPARSLAARRRLVQGRPQSIDEKIRLIETLARLGADTGAAHADLVPALAGELFRYLPEHRQPEPELTAFMGQVLCWLAEPGMDSHAQLFQDYWALHECAGKRDGYFVEFGAADGVTLSNTLLLEQRFGWRGVLAEPNPDYIDALRRNRRSAVSDACVWRESGHELDFVRDGYLSTIAAFDDGAGERDPARRVRVRTLSLMDLLAEYAAPSAIDFLSIDTEGSEYDILERFDFDRYDIACIAVEHNYGPRREDLHALLSARGYRRRFPSLSRWDDWYVRRRDR
jgi:FkbM family methyltransferase